MKLFKGCTVVVLALLVFAIVWFWQSDWLKIDTCLDGGGRWDYDKKTCQYAG